MKKFLVALAVVCMISLLAVSAFAAYPQTTDDWKVKATTEADGSVKITYTATVDGATTVNNVEIAIYTSKPDFTGKDMIDTGATYGDKIGNGDVNHPDERILTVGTGDNAYPFEDGKTYYITLCALTDNTNWTWNTTAIPFTYGEAAADTADLSVIAYAVAAITGCGALVIAKRK